MNRVRFPFRKGSVPRRIALAITTVLVAVLVLVPRQTESLVQALGASFGQLVAFPVESIGTINLGIKSFIREYLALRGVREENRRLREEMKRLESRLAELQEQTTATDRLAALLELKKRTPVPTVAARVVGRDVSNWYHGLILDKGDADGLREGMGVINASGVVGRIVKTTPSTAVVLLLTDPNSAITGLIRRTRDEGIVQGTAQKGVRMKYIPLLSPVKSGDTVVTSGFTGGFPRGIPIGSVVRIEKAENNLFQVAFLTPNVQVGKVEEVLIITSVPERDSP